MPASLRSDGFRDHPGMPFGIIPDSAFGFAGIPMDVKRAKNNLFKHRKEHGC
jgi:hypothetical protein